MTDAMSKKEKLARGSAVIKVMKVIPRPGNYLKSYIDPRKLPKAPKVGPKGVLADMPWLDVKNAIFMFSPNSARVLGPKTLGGPENYCDTLSPDKDPKSLGLPEGSEMMEWFDYRIWSGQVNPLADGNLAEHFNIMLGLLISMALDSENANFADVEAYPCVQFLRTIKTNDGQIPFNTASFISYIEFVCQKMVDEG